MNSARKMVPKFKCSVDQCTKEYRDNYYLKQHIATIHHGKRFPCPFCGSKFTCKSNRRTHIVSAHTLEKAYKCEKCPMAFSSPQVLRVHQDVHTEEMPQNCVLCSKQFSHFRSLKEHMGIVHNPKRTRRFQCSTCLKSFFTRSKLNRHTLIHNRAQDKFGCYFCKKRFTEQSTLQYHLLTHTQEKPFVCLEKTCQFSAAHPASLAQHIKRHHSPAGRPQSRTWSCYFCSKSLASSTSLTNHLRSHTMEKPFTCGLCFQRFKVYSRLEHHISGHTMEKPFKCRECLKPYTRNAYLQRHIRSNHGVKSNISVNCVVSFT